MTFDADQTLFSVIMMVIAFLVSLFIFSTIFPGSFPQYESSTSDIKIENTIILDNHLKVEKSNGSCIFYYKPAADDREIIMKYEDGLFSNNPDIHFTDIKPLLTYTYHNCTKTSTKNIIITSIKQNSAETKKYSFI